VAGARLRRMGRELRYARRAAGGSWVDVHNALAGLREWAEPTDGDDVLADWIGLAADAQGNLHAVWHGTANTRIYGNDQPFYARRDASGPGAWQRRWSTPEVLYRTDRSKGE